LNYLAHLALSPDDPAIMTGNFIADDIPFKEISLLPEEIKAGIELHRKIDTYTDRHPAFRRGVAHLRGHHRKYAPVVLDILNDHLLSRCWSQWYDQAEQDFHQHVYTLLSTQLSRLPPKISIHVSTLLEYQYLKAYGSKDGLRGIMKRIDKKTKFASDFVSSIDHLYEDYDFFEEVFKDLYQDVKGMVDDFYIN